MTQEKMNEVFKTSLGQQCLSIFTTSDDRMFIRREEAELHTTNMINAVGNQEYIDTTITEWFDENI